MDWDGSVHSLRAMTDALDAACSRAAAAEQEASDWRRGFSSPMSRLRLICGYLAAEINRDSVLKLLEAFPEDEEADKKAAERLVAKYLRP